MSFVRSSRNFEFLSFIVLSAPRNGKPRTGWPDFNFSVDFRARWGVDWPSKSFIFKLGEAVKVDPYKLKSVL